MQIKTIEISGFVSCFNTLRRPFKKECRSEIIEASSWKMEFGQLLYYPNMSILIDDRDIKLLQRLIKNGDEHAKAIRLINVTAEIQAPLFWWSEMDTYEVGVINGCSESTMHTLKKEQLSQANFEYPILDCHIETLQMAIDENFDNDIDLLKNYLPSGYLQVRDINFSYQTLRRICKQRANHKLPQWKVFIDWVKTLPLSEELIFI